MSHFVNGRRKSQLPTPDLNTFKLPLLRRLFVLMIAACLSGCHMAQKTFSVDKPRSHRTATDHFEIRSDFRIAKDSPLVLELEELQKQITSALQLPKQRDPVIVYLFSDEQTYRNYMQTTWPTLPARRAYFVGTSRELAVYSFHSETIQEDLRHEFTHGLLHASLNTVPLWLDEGLAEYFEVRGREVGREHSGHVRYLQTARVNGWTPSLYKLEQMSDFQKMTQQDYAESWGWVHFMLHTNEQTRQVLINYLAELETRTVPGKLLPLLEKAAPSYYDGMLSHVSNMSRGIEFASRTTPSR